MRAFGVIEAIDLSEDGPEELVIMMAGAAAGLCFSEVFEEAFAGGTVKRTAFLREGLYDIPLIRHPFKGIGRILRASVGV